MKNYKYKWRYTGEERNPGEDTCCQDCGIPYAEIEDMIIPDNLWEKINPTIHKGGGILCPTCIVNRLHYIDCWYNDDLYVLGKRPNKLIRLYRKWRITYLLYMMSKKDYKNSI